MKELPDNPNWLLRQTVRAFYQKHYRTASFLGWLQSLLNPNDYYALCWHANSLYFSGRFNDHKAASIYKRAIEMNTNLPLAHAGLGKIHYSNALRIHREYSSFPSGDWVMFGDESGPDESSAEARKPHLNLMGFADYECGNRKVAIKELEKAAELTDDKAEKVEILLMAAEIHCIIDNRDGIEAYSKILTIAPDNIIAHFHLAGCYAATYYLHKQSPPTSYYGEHFSGNHKLALKEYKFIKENAPELAADLESVLERFNVQFKDIQ